MKIVSTFTERFNEALESKQVSAAELVRRTGIKHPTISQYRSGYSQPKRDKLYAIAKALSVSPAWLMGYDTSPIPSDVSDEAMEIAAAYDNAPEADKEMVRRLLKYAELFNNVRDNQTSER